jgi:alginate O-acetyltransferase complex protein AlgI
MYGNLVFVFLVCGLWHGANWTFVAWGAFHGLLLIIERATDQRSLGSVNHESLRRAVTLLLVLLGWVVFRADSITHALQFYDAMFSLSLAPLAPEVAVACTTRNLLILAAATFVVFLPRSFSGSALLTSRTGWVPVLARVAVLIFAPAYIALLLASGSFSPFLYFQF